ncbi:HI_0552 family protein [Suttonella ornithocola]|uniref:Glucose-6-phosphate 1-dehydrogenase n=1 Tax=Suttonella ornithocola TaxID=279832 RepID=A0A380MM47_9GAMM|nr:HI_0552 family protein [Suttonella ornithocola]SUO93328.1 Glucose-6-phosphate 1-dehydrogenase [Suttonella ornithocola]
MSSKISALSAAHCDLFDRPCFQFAQLRRYQPEAIDTIKAEYKVAWQDWRALIQAVSLQLGEDFAEPHIERWCNGWQVRAHFFAFFKYQFCQSSAPIFSLLLNRRRLTVSLDWHVYRAKSSILPLSAYRQWQMLLAQGDWDDFELWKNDDSEYADYLRVAEYRQAFPNVLQDGFTDENSYFRIGKHLAREVLADKEVQAFIVETIEALRPLYEACFLSN